MSSYDPIELRVDKENSTVELLWSDDHKSSYPYRYLRGFCPCASCQGHGRGEAQFIAVDLEYPLAVTSLSERGNYSIAIDWSDGHTTGIYTWDYLRQLCSCDACLKSSPETHAWHRYPLDQSRDQSSE